MTGFSLDYANTAHNIVRDFRFAKHVLFEKKTSTAPLFLSFPALAMVGLI